MRAEGHIRANHMCVKYTHMGPYMTQNDHRA